MEAVTPPGFEAYVDDWAMSPGLLCGGFLFLTGMTGHPASAGGPPPTRAMQAEGAFERVGAVLEAAGAGWGDVVEMTSYHVDISATLAAFKEVRERHVRRPYPAWTAIGVAALASPGIVHELRVIARAPVSGRR